MPPTDNEPTTAAFPGIDKDALGRRIRQIRLRAGLKQWELARRLGTTQSAVHKYEHGVVPEARRLLALARIGDTSVEWVLTGRHWENGSEAQERLSPDLLLTAALLRDIEAHERARLDEALALVREAVYALGGRDGTAPPAGAPASAADSRATLEVIETACRIQGAVLRRIVHEAGDRLAASSLLSESVQAKNGVRQR